MKVEPLSNLYLGPEVSSEALASVKKNVNGRDNVKVTEGVTNADIARLLASGEVVARVAGRTEFGARALGNRSILADPGKPDVVKQINEMIKKRDFWMPFALSLLDSHEEFYLKNPKGLQAQYMANAFDTKDKDYERIRSGTHPYDRSVRPQVVTREMNPEYYDLINEFSKLTGTGALLNTSLNLHGLPLVSDPYQALYVLENSGLRYLVIENTLFQWD